MRKELEPYIARAIRTGTLPEAYFLDWRDKEKYSIADLVKINHGLVMCRWIEAKLRLPEGKNAGGFICLSPAQVAFICHMMNNRTGLDITELNRIGVMSISKRNGKSLLVASIICCMLHIGHTLLSMPRNATIVSGANTKSQASILHKLATLMMEHDPRLMAKLKISAFHKSMIHVDSGVNYHAIASDGTKQHGLTVYCGILDEAHGITATKSPLTDFFETSMSSFDDSKMIVISTQAKSDTAYLSQLIDNSIASQSRDTVIHLYTADPDCDLDDEEQWVFANPSLPMGYISIEALRSNCRASMLSPAKEMSFRNYILNGRVSEQAAYLAPRIWDENGGDIYLSDFRGDDVTVNLGIDLSKRNDWTAFCLACKSHTTGKINLIPLTFTRSDDLAERERTEKIPYAQYIQDGDLIVAGTASISYKAVARLVMEQLAEWRIEVDHIIFDQWNHEIFKQAAEDIGFCPNAEWHKCSQGFSSMSPRVDSFEDAVLERQINHGDSPILRLAVHHAKVIYNSDGLRKIDKQRYAYKVDPLISAMMASHYLIHDVEYENNVPLVG